MFRSLRVHIWRDTRLLLSLLAGWTVLIFLTVAVLGDPGDCTACHVAEDVLPEGHPPTAGMDADACLACHQDGSPLDLHGTMPLSHFHMLAGVSCAACHGQNISTPAPMSTEQCLVCHGPLDELAGLTAHLDPYNPHQSPHGPAYAECSLCHQVHRPSVNFCADCHDVDFEVP